MESKKKIGKVVQTVTINSLCTHIEKQREEMCVILEGIGIKNKQRAQLDGDKKWLILGSLSKLLEEVC